jgi:hypothetical protein
LGNNLDFVPHDIASDTFPGMDVFFASFAGVDCYHTVPAGEQNYHHLDFGVAIRQCFAEAVVWCHCRPVKEEGTNDWFVHHRLDWHNAGAETGATTTTEKMTVAEAAIAAAKAAQKMGTLLSGLRKANARLDRNDALEEAAIAARVVLGDPADKHGQELPGWGKLPQSKSVLEALADIRNQWWQASPAEVVKVFARAGPPEVAEYATGYDDGRPLRDIELTEAAQAAR